MFNIWRDIARFGPPSGISEGKVKRGNGWLVWCE